MKPASAAATDGSQRDYPSKWRPWRKTRADLARNKASPAGDAPNTGSGQTGNASHVRSQSILNKKVEEPSLPLANVRHSSPSSGSDDDQSMNSRRLQKLYLDEKSKAGPHPGQKRLPEDSTEDRRPNKLNKSPEATGSYIHTSFNDRDSYPRNGHFQTNQMSLGNDEESHPPLGQASSGGLRGSAHSPSADRGRNSTLPHRERKRNSTSSSPTREAGDLDDDPGEGDTSMLLQPDTRPITAEQLVNEVKGIYSGLLMVEKKCVEITTQRAQAGTKLSNDQWQALIALHRTLLHEHHDFFLASQHPTASPALRRLATKYAMPARMWRNGIHAFLELLRQQLPESYDHMLAFVYIAYSMMALLKESVPSFLETWIECLGDLARYRMAIEEIDMRDREIWSNVARMWYNKAADRSPNVGRIQHHLAVLARPNVVMQLFYYSKALIAVIPFVNARESVMLLFSPFLDKEKAEAQYQKHTALESSLVTAWGIAFTKGSISTFIYHSEVFLSGLDAHISRTTTRWKIQGPEVASSLIAGILDYGSEENHLWNLCKNHMETIKAAQEVPEDQAGQRALLAADASRNKEKPPSPTVDDFHLKEELRMEYWTSVKDKPPEDRPGAPPPRRYDKDSKFSSSDEVASHALSVWSKATSIVAAKIGDKNTVPYIHLTLAFLWSLSFVPGALIYLEKYVPWSRLVMYLNTLGRSGVYDTQVESPEFPQSRSGVGRQLPEDFPIRGLVWAAFYYPRDFFIGQVVDEDERQLEMPSHAAPRAERCLWLGARIASLGRYMHYNVETKLFSATEYALSLAAVVAPDTFEDRPSQTATMTDDPEFDAVMVDV